MIREQRINTLDLLQVNKERDGVNPTRVKVETCMKYLANLYSFMLAYSRPESAIPSFRDGKVTTS